jgi:peptide/nickel transport system substrate-binding protein
VEQRFTVKDFFLFAFLALLLVMILLSMYMVDRQWERMAEMERTITEQSDSLRDLVRMVGTGISTGNAVNAARGVARTQTIPDAFRRAYQATKMKDYAAGDWLVSPFSTGIKTLTPLISSDAYSAEVQAYVLESLLIRNPETLKWQGLIATDNGWTVSDGGLAITFQMRKGLKFSDGEPMDAKDVLFSFNFIMNKSIAAPRQRAYFEKIESVEATGPYKVVFHFKEPYFESLQLAGTMAILPKHFYAQYLKRPQAFNESTGLLVGSGPYRLEDPKGWSPDEGIVELERNPYYWGPIQPPFDELLWKVIANDSARLTTFRNGEIDLYSARPREYKTLLNDQGLAQRTQNLAYMSPTAGYSYIGWNERRNGRPTLFADKRVRQAMTYLTDRKRIVKELMLGYAEIAVSPFSPRSPQHDKSLKPRGYNLEKAKALLAQAGYDDRNGDSVIEDAHGKPFKFDLVYFQDSEDTQRIVLFLKDLYARAGILMIPKPTEWSVMIDLLQHKDFDAITLGWTSDVETDIFQIFHSSQTIPGGDNFINYRNPHLDTLIERARATVNEKARMQLWHKAERVLYEDQPYTFLMRVKSLIFIDDRMHNVQVTKLGLNKESLPVEWFVPAGMQKYTN